ncbi:MAG: sel1 repeat family protein [Candidatus Methanomethylophilaceae archaeon]|nr:sel1 repeat family protein [Candidatus Methanomethylophilaceae archaeon]
MPVRDEHEGIQLSGGFLPWISADPEDFSDVENGKYAYARGFLISEKELGINPYFSEKAVIGGRRIYCHDLLAADSASDGEFAVCVLGVSYFIEDTSAGDAEILLGELRKSDENFIRKASRLCGRYVIVAGCRKGAILLGDPCGLKTVYYNSVSRVAGSHLNLVKRFSGSEKSAMQRIILKNKYKISGEYPGDYTPYKGTRLLIPDFYLSLDDFSVRRFYPFGKTGKTADILAVKNNVQDMLRRSFLKLSGKKRICMSVSDGKDSKVTFYCLSEFKGRIFFFTESRDNDIGGAGRLMERNGCRWIGSDSKDLKFSSESSRGFSGIIEHNVFPKPARQALVNHFWNANLFGLNDEWISIHSNCSEAGRGRTLGDYDYFREEFSFEEFFRCYIEGTVAWRPESFAEKQKKAMASDQKFREMMEDYFERLDLSGVSEMGYDPWDFVYTAQRVAGFLSQTHMCFDLSYDSVSLFNSRDILEEMWKIPEKYRNVSCLLYTCIMNECDPEWQQWHMGANFIPMPSDYDMYAEIYGGKVISGLSDDPDFRIDLAKRVLDSNYSVRWAHISLLSDISRLEKEEAKEIARDSATYDSSIIDTSVFQKAISSLRFGSSRERTEFAESLFEACPESAVLMKYYADALWACGSAECLKKYTEILIPFAEAGEPAALGRLGKAYAYGKGLPQDPEKAVSLLRRAYSENIYWSNDLFDALKLLNDENYYPEMLGIARKFAETGNADAEGRLGMIYAEGLGVPADPEKARNCFLRAAAGNPYWKKMLRGISPC